MKRSAICIAIAVSVVIGLSGCRTPITGNPTNTPTPRPPAPTPVPTETPTATPTEELPATATDAPTATPEGPVSGVVIVRPSADSYIDEAQPDVNFGAAEQLWASAGIAPGEGDDNENNNAAEATSETPTEEPSPTEEGLSAEEELALLRFDVTGIPEEATVTAATLRLFIQSPTHNERFVHAVDAEWDENLVTWENAPAVGDRLATFTQRVALHVWDQVRLENIVEGNGSYSFYVTMTGSNAVAFRSREFERRAPTLIVEWSHELRVSNPPSPSIAGDPPVLIGAGDIAECGSDRDERTAEIIEQTAGLVFTLGDNVYLDGTVDEFFTCYDESWGQFRDRTMPAVGDHEYNTPGAAGYFHYFGPSAGDRGYYSYDVGEWHVVVLNSNCEEAGGCDEDSPQGEWLRTDLLAHTNDCLMAYWHEPRFSLRGEANMDQTEHFWQMLYIAGAELVLNGDEHYYARFAPQTPEGLANENGIRQFIVGTGGRSRYEFTTSLPNVEVQDNTSYGVLKLTLNPGSYDWEFIHVDVPLMEFTDAGSAECH